MKRNNLLAEIQSNIKQLSDSQLADVADYIEMLMGNSGEEEFSEEEYDEEDFDLDDDTSYKDGGYDDNLY
jgi:hypothetical protein